MTSLSTLTNFFLHLNSMGLAMGYIHNLPLNILTTLNESRKLKNISKPYNSSTTSLPKPSTISSTPASHFTKCNPDEPAPSVPSKPESILTQPHSYPIQSTSTLPSLTMASIMNIKPCFPLCYSNPAQPHPNQR